jgi:hypothetical protein
MLLATGGETRLVAGKEFFFLIIAVGLPLSPGSVKGPVWAVVCFGRPVTTSVILAQIIHLKRELFITVVLAFNK